MYYRRYVKAGSNRVLGHCITVKRNRGSCAAPGTPWALRPATAPRKSIKSHETVNLFSDILGDSEVSLTTIRNTLRHCTFFGLYGYFKHIVPSFLYQ